MVSGKSGNNGDHRQMMALAKPSWCVLYLVAQAAPSEIIVSIVPVMPSETAPYIQFLGTTRSVWKVGISLFELVQHELISSVGKALRLVKVFMPFLEF
jgi:hypothetical protein